MSENRVIKNATWIVAGKIVQSLIGLVISMLTARYLGPTNFGTINYAAAIVAFVTPIVHLGIDSILVREIIEEKDTDGTILGTSITLNIISSILCIAGVIAFSVIMNPGDNETIIVCSLYSIQLFFQSFELMQYWFQAKLLSKYTTIASLVAYICVSLYRIYLLASAKNVYWFSLSYTLDYFVIAVLLIVMYVKLGGKPFQFSFSAGRRMLNVGKYYIVSNMMITIYAQTDKIMLKSIISSEETAFYSTAVNIAMLTNFVFSAILDSFRPVIFQYKKENQEKFEFRIIQLFAVVIYLSLLQSVFITFFARWIVLILYGKDYIDAIPVLRIVVWYTTFAYLGSARSIWILSEGKQKYLLPINMMGATLNIILNYVLIKAYGAKGAAIASLVTHIFTNVITGLIIPTIQPVNQLMLKSLRPKYILEVVSQLLNVVKNRFIHEG